MIILYLLIILLCIITLRLSFCYSVTVYSCFCIPDFHLIKYTYHPIGVLFYLVGCSFRFVSLKRHFKTIFHSLLFLIRILSICIIFIRIHFVRILFIHILFIHILFFISIPFIRILFISILFICVVFIRVNFIRIFFIRIFFMLILFTRILLVRILFIRIRFIHILFTGIIFIRSYTVLRFYIEKLRKSNLGHKSISFIGPSVWNKLTNDLKILNTTTSFTYNYKKLLLKKLE